MLLATVVLLALGLLIVGATRSDRVLVLLCVVVFGFLGLILLAVAAAGPCWLGGPNLASCIEEHSR